MMRSLRTRLFFGTTLASALILGILAVAIDTAIHRTLLAEFDAVLLERARTLASLVEQTGPEIHFDYQSAQFPEFDRAVRPAYFAIYLDGVRFKQSKSLGTSLPAAIPRAGGPTVAALSLPDGRPGRVIFMAFQPFLDITPDQAESQKKFPRPAALITVAQDTADLDRTFSRLRLLIVALCAAAALLSGIALLFVVQHAIRPVRALASEIESLQPADLSTILHSDQFPTELAPVVDRLNDLFHRLAAAFTRERSFTADAAHELRNPVAALLATLEVARSRPRDAAGYQSAIDKSLALLTYMQSVIENLLLVARFDAGQLTARQSRVDLAVPLAAAIESVENGAARRNLAFSRAIASVPPLLADPDYIRIILNNLLDNAVTYSPVGSTITVTLTSTPAAITLTISNPAPALTQADLPHLTDRFWQKDPARATTGLHTGLGLSLTQRLLAIHHAPLTFSLADALFTVTAQFPLAQVTAHSPSPAS